MKNKQIIVVGLGRFGNALAETLVEKCTSVKFIVGRALNPAHQNPDMPISLSIKLRLVKDISECLKRLGKPTTLKYC